MRFSTGIFDAIFGEKVQLLIPRSDGTSFARKVSRRWLESMEQAGQIWKSSESDAMTLRWRDRPSRRKVTDSIARAYLLLSVSSEVAADSKSKYSKRFRELKSIASGDWEFFATTAAVWSACTMIEFHVPKSQRSDVERAIENKIREWHPRGLDAMEDLSAFVARSCKGRGGGHLIPLSVGMWLLWNLLDRAPTAPELSIAHAMGRSFCEEFATYWQD